MNQEQSHDIYCQSCGMPLAKVEDFGTNADGSRSRNYCSFCYKKGAFTDPDRTLEEMIKISAQGWSDNDPNMSYEDALVQAKSTLTKAKRWQ